MADNENPTRLRGTAPPRDDHPLRQRVLARWEEEGGATPCGPQEAVAAQTSEPLDPNQPNRHASPPVPGPDRMI
jgi:hypothetical protein